MVFGLLAIVCWLILVGAIVALPIVAMGKHRRRVAALSAFLIGGFLVATLVWRITRPEGLTFRESLKAGLTNEGLRVYGHAIEHWAENAIVLSSYAWVLGGAICAALTLAAMRAMTRRQA